jgi:hypothetical protein
MKQLHNRIVFKPIKVEELTAVEQRQAMESLIFITKKKYGRIKARTCANGSTQREYTKRNKAASLTALTESHLITAVIDAKQGQDVMTANIPNAFVQTEIESKANGDQTIILPWQLSIRNPSQPKSGSQPWYSAGMSNLN